MKQRGGMRPALAAMVLGLVAAVATAAPPLPAEHFFQHPAVLAAQLSPSGRQVAITTARGGDAVRLLVLDVAGDGPPRAVAGLRDADVVSVAWVDDQRLVFNARNLGVGVAMDRQLGPGLFAVNADGSDLRMLVRRQPGPAGSHGDVRTDRALSANHRLLHIPLAQPGVAPGEVVIGRLARDGRGATTVQPLWLDTRTGLFRAMALDGAPEAVRQWWFDSRGTPRLALTEHEGRQALHWRGPADDSWRVLAEAPSLHMPFAPQAVADDGTLYIRHAQGPRGEMVLSTYDFARNAPAAQPLVRTPGFDFAGRVLLDRPGGTALGVRTELEQETTRWFEPSLQRLQAEVDAALPGRINQLDCRRCGARDMVALVTSHSDRDPGELLLAEDGRLQRLGPWMDGIDPGRMGRMAYERISARDGQPLPLWLTFPPGARAGQPLPAVVLAHGGPWTRGGHWRWEPMAQFLASRGWLVISPDFRGSTGYGVAHFRAGFGQWGLAMQDDLADALQWARRQGLASDRACIAGASYGGYATLMGLVRDPDLYRCGVAWAAVTDPFLYLQGAWWLADDIPDEARAHRLPELLGDAERDADRLRQTSPLVQAARITAPLLLAHGGMDLRVPLSHGLRLRDAMAAAGHAPEWISYPDEGHGWQRVDHRVDFAERMAAFLHRHLDAAPADPAR